MGDVITDDVASLGTTLSIWAHPDDETYLSGGLMAALRDHGQAVVCVTATRGEQGSDRDAAETARLRSNELGRALAVLGVTEHRWLDLPDGELEAVAAEEIVERICALITATAPQTVVTFGPDGITGHADHRTVSRWTTEAFRRAAAPGSRLLYAATTGEIEAQFADLNEEFDVYLDGYPVLTPPDELYLRLTLSGPPLARKVSALREHASQTAAVIEAVGAQRYAAWVSTEAFTLAPVRAADLADRQ